MLSQITGRVILSQPKGAHVDFVPLTLSLSKGADPTHVARPEPVEGGSYFDRLSMSGLKCAQHEMAPSNLGQVHELNPPDGCGDI